MMSATFKWSGSEHSLMRGLKMACLFSTVAVLAACGSIPKTYYYTLSRPAVPAAAGDPRTPFVLGVEHFRAPEALRDDRIVFFESPTEMNYYQYSRWSSDPATMLTEQTARYLQNMGIFQEVRLLPSREPMDFILRGRLMSFEEADYEGKGRVSLELSLLRVRDHKVVWQGQHDASAPFQGKGMEGVVTALNAASQQVLQAEMPAIAEQIEAEFKECQK
jgi:ABC-type uncharacterized transport system auxiliary subunit